MSRTRIYPQQISRACDGCDNLFQPLMRDVVQGNGRFCSRTCSNKYQRKPEHSTPRKKKEVIYLTLTCSMCQVIFKRDKRSHTENKKRGIYFCSRKCKDLGQRISSNLACIPSHYGDGNSVYRQIAFRHHGKKCNRCGYDRYESVLQVHHKDRNRQNNLSNNLEVLCPTCHVEEHFLASDGMFALRS